MNHNGQHRHLPGAQQQDMSRSRRYNHHPAPMYSYPYGYPQQYAPQYHNGMPPVYQQYQSYGRSTPPPMQYPYMPPPVTAYSRPPPMPMTSAYPPSLPLPAPAPVPVPLPVPAPAPAPAHAPAPYTPSSSTHSSQNLPGPLTPPTPQPVQTTMSQYPPAPKAQFIPPLPWLSRPDLPFPKKTHRSRRKRRTRRSSEEAVKLPDQYQTPASEQTITDLPPSPSQPLETPLTSQPPSEAAPSTNPTSPSSTQRPITDGAETPTNAPLKTVPRATIPALPVIPIVPKQTSTKSASDTTATQVPDSDSTSTAPGVDEAPTDTTTQPTATPEVDSPARKAPVSWSGLFRGPVQNVAATNGNSSNSSSTTPAGSFIKANQESFADALQSFSASSKGSKIAFLEPRGLVNTGNMCYMNSVLQVLIFCIPFYDFLDQVSKRATYSFKSSTPLVDAMIMFMREFPVIDSAVSRDQLRMRLKDNELEQYGEAFTPDFVYDVIRQLPRFSTMRRGHQQDAEEFLGFLLEGLHDECVQVMQASGTNTPTKAVEEPAAESSTESAVDGWLEVGHKQKAAVTRSSGTISTSPITKIFGGTLRSEFRVPGLKDSVTLEPYQPLQLDIGSPQINNIVDALKGLTKPEILHGDFNSPRNSKTATKQVLIETLPPVLILHLKRFQYDNTGGTQKIWKKIGYPLELEIPKEVFSRQKQTALLNHGGLPKYRLTAVVYHHGKNASGGHYTVDVRRQDGREWIRLDDTVIRRVRSEDVAEGGSEESPKVLAAAAEAHKKDGVASGNIFAQMSLEDDEAGEEEWKQVNGTEKTGKWSGAVNGAAKGRDRFSVKDNKVAYLLFYQKIMD